MSKRKLNDSFEGPAGGAPRWDEGGRNDSTDSTNMSIGGGEEQYGIDVVETPQLEEKIVTSLQKQQLTNLARLVGTWPPEVLSIDALSRLKNDIYNNLAEASDLEEYFNSPSTLRPNAEWLRTDFSWDDETLLTYAVKKEKVEVVRCLLHYHLDVEKKNDKGVTAISTAAHKGNTEIIRILLECGCDANRENKSGSTALIQASHFGHMDCVKILLEAGADADHANPKGTTALMRASQEGYVQISRLLILHGAQVTRKNNEGMNALMLASQRGHHKMVLLLMLAGAKIDEQTSQGSTALMLACKRGNEHCVIELIGLGAEIFVLDGKERTAVDTATKKANALSNDIANRKQFTALIPWLRTSVQVQMMAMSVRTRRNKLLFKAMKEMQQANVNTPWRLLVHEYMDYVLSFVRREFGTFSSDLSVKSITQKLYMMQSSEEQQWNKDAADKPYSLGFELLRKLLPKNGSVSLHLLHQGLIVNVITSLTSRATLRDEIIRAEEDISRMATKRNNNKTSALCVKEGEDVRDTHVLMEMGHLPPPPPTAVGSRDDDVKTLPKLSPESLPHLFVHLDLAGNTVLPPVFSTSSNKSGASSSPRDGKGGRGGTSSMSSSVRVLNGSHVRVNAPLPGYDDWTWPLVLAKCARLPEHVFEAIVEFIPSPRIWDWSLHRIKTRAELAPAVALGDCFAIIDEILMDTQIFSSSELYRQGGGSTGGTLHGLSIAIARNPQFESYLARYWQMSPEMLRTLTSWADIQAVLLRESSSEEMTFKPAVVQKLMADVYSLMKWYRYKHSYASVGMPRELADAIDLLRSASSVKEEGGAGDVEVGSGAGVAANLFSSSSSSSPAAKRGVIITLEECVTNMVENVPPFDASEDPGESMDQQDTDGDAAGAGEDANDEESDTDVHTAVTGNTGLPP